MKLFSPPKDWRDLQNKTCKLLKEGAFYAEVEKDIQTVRGPVNIDVYAETLQATPPSKILVECKYWKRAIPQHVILSFRTIIEDYGANHGYIISLNGFQKGAYEKKEFTNIEIIDWSGFCDIFGREWRQRRFMDFHNRYSVLDDYCNLSHPLLRSSDFQTLLDKKKKQYFDLVEIVKTNNQLLDGIFYWRFGEHLKSKSLEPFSIRMEGHPLVYEYFDKFFDAAIEYLQKQIDLFDAFFGKQIRLLED